VFLLSIKQLKEWVYDRRDVLGADWYIDEGAESYYWLNTASADDFSSVRGVYLNGEITSHSAGEVAGVRHALKLNLAKVNLKKRGNGSKSSPYVIRAQD
jgi:hypothetical protein